MQMIHLITYGDERFTQSKARIYNDVISSGWFDSVAIYGPEDLDAEFKERFQNILQLPRGGGYWIWKPYIINKHLSRMNNNDILIYLDSGCTINLQGRNRFNEYIEMLNNSDDGIISFKTNYLEKTWTVKEIFNYFNVSENSDIVNTGQIIGGVKILKKNANSINIINLWLKALYDNPLLFTDYYNNNQCPEYIENRHDQSICSIICKLHKTIVLKDETYFDNGFYNNESFSYPFWATRLRV